MHFESCFSLSGSYNPRGQENVKCVILVPFLLFRFCINLIFFRSVSITVGSECVHHHIVKMQSCKATNAQKVAALSHLFTDLAIFLIIGSNWG